MKIILLKRKTKPFKRFKKRQWELVHNTYFGETKDWNYWDDKYIFLKAIEKNRVIGALTGKLTAGVLFIDELIVRQNMRGKGVGTKLIEKAESWAKKHKAHEMYLVTGRWWKAVMFYKKLKFFVAAKLPNHFHKRDFVLMRRFI